MRGILRMMTAVVAILAFIGLLGAQLRPLALADDESEDDDSPSFYAAAKQVARPLPPATAIEIQIQLLKHQRA